MAIEIKMPNEIRKYEAKIAGPFTLRNLVCLCIFLPLGFVVFILTKPYIGMDMAGFLVFPFGGLAWLFGWYKPYGLKFEKYMQTVFINSFIAPSKRVYKTENYYSKILKEIEKADEQAELESKFNGSIKKIKAYKKKKYKRSKLAIK